MAKKYSAADSERMEFLEDTFVYEIMQQGYRVSKVLIKGGFGDWLMVITARTADGPQVAFVGSSSIIGLARKLHEQYLKGEIVWKPDRYADKS